MNHRSFALLFAGAIAGGLLIACTASSGDDVQSDDSAITGSLAATRACAIRSAYEAAALEDMTALTQHDFQQATAIVDAAAATALAFFDVKGVGRVYVAEWTDGRIDFYAQDASLLAQLHSANNDWRGPTQLPLSCSSAAPVPEAGTSDPEPESCLLKVPIDSTQYPYKPASPINAGTCSAAEAQTITTYYRDHADAILDGNDKGWRNSVSPACAQCAFGESFYETWAPIILDWNGSIWAVNGGGCIEHVSGSEACGRAHSQLEKCEVDACVKTCQTQEEYNDCRQDPSVLQGACKGAWENVTSSCDQQQYRNWQQTCRGTTYTFEAPVKIACVDGFSPPTHP